MKLTPEHRRQIIDNVRARRAAGTCDHEVICAIAGDAGISTDYVYRLARGGIPERTRQPWQLTDTAIDLYYSERACIPDIHRSLLARGDCPVGLRQLQRAFREQLGSDERAFVRWGAARRQSQSGTVRWEAPARNAVWQTDHVQLGVPVLLPGHSKPKKLWMTYFIDCYSRMVMGWMVSVRQSSDAVLEALRDAILHDPDSEHVYGGTPGVVMYDNGLTFLAEVVQDAASYLDFRTRPVAPYSPHQNGKVERCHQTISRLALSEIAAWDHGPRNKAGRLYDYTPISERELIARVGAAVQVYNFERPHSALGGRAPWQAFADDQAPLRLQSPERLRFALRHRKIQKVSAHGVYKHGRWYRHVEIDTRVGDSVVVAWLRKDERSVDVYNLSGELLCTAHPHEMLEAEDVVAVKRRERERNVAQDKRLRKTISRSLEAYAPANQPDGLKVTTLPTARAARRPGDTGDDDDALLDDLGLRGRVGAAWPGDRRDG